jgi:hypothetical protein
MAGENNLFKNITLLNSTTMTLSQCYQMAQAARHKQPCLDYPYIGIPDEDEEDIIDKLNIKI